MICQYCQGAKRVVTVVERHCICPRCWGTGLESIQRHADHPDAGGKKDCGRVVKLYPTSAPAQPSSTLDIEGGRYVVTLPQWEADQTTTYVNARSTT